MKIILNEARLMTQVRKMMTVRARTALAIYRSYRAKADDPAYPFARRPGDGRHNDPRRSKISRLPNGIRIEVATRGAPYLEEGNDAGGDVIEAEMRIPLKRGRQRRDRGKIVRGQDGKWYLSVQRVRTYRGKHVLERSVRDAFGLKQRSL